MTDAERDAAITASESDQLKELVSDHRWGSFWFLRAIKTGRKEQELHWQVWDFTNVWYPSLQSKDKLIVRDAPTPIAAAIAALATKDYP